MIVRELYITRTDGVKLFRTYSDSNFVIHKVNTEEYYAEAIDIENAPYIYEETKQPCESMSDTEFRKIVEGVL